MIEAEFFPPLEQADGWSSGGMPPAIAVHLEATTALGEARLAEMRRLFDLIVGGATLVPEAPPLGIVPSVLRSAGREARRP